MGGVEIAGYEPLVNDVKELIHKKQYHVLKIMNTETINLYWEIGEEIYRQQEEKEESIWRMRRYCGFRIL